MRETLRQTHDRRGTILVVVLVVVVLLALATYRHTETMIVELHAAEVHGRKVQAALLSESGVCYLQSVLSSRTPTNNVDLFRAIPVGASESAERDGCFTVLSTTSRGLFYGPANLSGRLNLNLLPLLDEEVAEQLLLTLPGMELDTAHAILDWIDEGDEPRPFGAESNYYRRLGYSCPNGPLRSLDGLLYVRGVTPALLYGEDVNRNGVLDPQENDGDRSLPLDNADGLLQTGWNVRLTVWSSQSNRTADGSSRIDVNNDDLAELYDTLEANLSTDAARFIVAYRLYGRLSSDPFALPEDVEGDTSSPLPTDRAQSTSTGPVEPIRRGGMMLNAGPRYSIRSIWDLVGIQVPLVDETGSPLKNPFSEQVEDARANIESLDEETTALGEYDTLGRIDIRSADPELLAGVPGLDARAADEIVRQRERAPHEFTMASLLSVVDVKKLAEAAPYLTAGGDVHIAQVVGHYPDGGPQNRVEVIIDATREPPRVRSSVDLSHLGRAQLSPDDE